MPTTSEPTRMVKTRYCGPTDSRGSRVIATHLTTKRRAILSWQHELDSSDNHEAAARILLGPDVPLLRCSVEGGGYVFAVGQPAKVTP